MAYARYGDRWYKVIVRSPERFKSVVGQYSNMPNAVFGAMRRLNVDLPGSEREELVSIACELLPPKPPRMTKAAYTRQLRQQHEAL